MAEMDRAECLRRLAQAGVGRVSTTVAALPTIFPVHYAMLDDDIVFRTGAGTTVADAVQDAVVAFEIDDIDPWSTTGWSIVVVGHAREVTGPDQIARAERLPLNRWQRGGAAETVLRISTDVVNGRTFGRTPPRLWSELRPDHRPSALWLRGPATAQ
jgi:nitroimidazol reductase NimA-like FMN-containing flavoprotein (pyridoxamine 5'-phosphate oxidase superfamily)